MAFVLNNEFAQAHQLYNSILFPGSMIGAVKNLEHQYVGINQKTSKLLGFDNPHELVNSKVTDESIRCKASQLSSAFIDEDKLSQDLDKSVTTLSFCSYEGDELKLLVSEKSLLTNQANKPIGYLIHSIDLTDAGIINLQPLLKKVVPIKMVNSQFSMVIKKEYPGIKLSIRQTECLYYIINGYSSAHIGKMISLSKRTVEAYVEHIKDKMLCCTKQELIEKAISLGYLQIIPQSIFSQLMVDK